MHTNQRLLGVNIDHVATVRQARGTRYPEVIHAALLAEQAGADSITLHLREDRRHIQDRDVRMLAECLQTHMNLEMAATAEMQAIAAEIKPSDCCLVPERREEITTEGGLNAAGQIDYLRDYCAVLAEAGVRVSLFIDAEEAQLEAAVQIGAPVVEIHTGQYAEASNRELCDQELARIAHAVEYGNRLGLQVNAGHGLHYHNVKPVAELAGIVEFNIGHAIIAQAIYVGLAQAVAEMKHAIQATSQ